MGLQHCFLELLQMKFENTLLSFSLCLSFTLYLEEYV
jgi:hypothetical protein